MMAVEHQSPAMTLGDLLIDLVPGPVLPPALAELPLHGLSLDSRELRPGDLFLACAGTAQHGMRFASAARDAGAVAVLAEPSDDWPESRLREVAGQIELPVLAVPDLGRRVGELAGRFYGRPDRAMRVVGITGTNGKTSVSHFLAQVLGPDESCAVMGTLGVGLPGALRPATHTTPDPVSLQAGLAELRDAGARAVAMEVSSHAIDQHRIGGISFDTAVFTNLTRDHLDYHGDMATYAEVKAELFRRPELRQAVLNVDDSFGLRLAEELRGRVPVVACGRRPEAVLSAERFVRASEIETRLHGLRMNFESSWGSGEIEVGLLGLFNVENLLLVIGVALSAGIELKALIPRLAGLRTVAGRMEAIRSPNAADADRPLVVIDYAHTPDALAKVLESLRPHVTGRLICVFGCGGDRDPGKRPQMGAIAESLADTVVLTDDNPRHEDGAAIVREILSGMQVPEDAGVERERATAIRRAIRNAAWGDLVLIAGKGHEDYQQFGDLKLPFSDLEHARSALGLTPIDAPTDARVDSGDRGGVA